MILLGSSSKTLMNASSFIMRVHFVAARFEVDISLNDFAVTNLISL